MTKAEHEKVRDWIDTWGRESVAAVELAKAASRCSEFLTSVIARNDLPSWLSSATGVERDRVNAALDRYWAATKARRSPSSAKGSRGAPE